MDPEKWRPVREQIEAARTLRDENTVAVAARAGIVVGTFLERNYPRAVGYAVDTSCNRVRISVDIEVDLTTGQVEAELALQPPAFRERASQTKIEPCPRFSRPTA